MLYVVWILAAVAVVAAAWSIVSALRASKARGGRTGQFRTAIGRRQPHPPLPRQIAPAGVGPPREPPARPCFPFAPRRARRAVDRPRTRLAHGRGESRSRVGPARHDAQRPDGTHRAPFKLRNSIMSWRGRAPAITGVCSGYVLCPNSASTRSHPTRPDERPADDWRCKACIRAVDFVVCRLPTGRPCSPSRSAAATNATLDTQDKMTLETLAEVGLPSKAAPSPEKGGDDRAVRPRVRRPRRMPPAPPGPLDDRPAESA